MQSLVSVAAKVDQQVTAGMSHAAVKPTSTEPQTDALLNDKVSAQESKFQSSKAV